MLFPLAPIILLRVTFIRIEVIQFIDAFNLLHCSACGICVDCEAIYRSVHLHSKDRGLLLDVLLTFRMSEIHFPDSAPILWCKFSN